MRVICTDGVGLNVKKSTMQKVPLLQACLELSTGRVQLSGSHRFLESDVVLEFVRWVESEQTHVRQLELLWLLIQCADYMGSETIVHAAVPRAAALLVGTVRTS
jgi:hypothetical protein